MPAARRATQARRDGEEENEERSSAFSSQCLCAPSSLQGGVPLFSFCVVPPARCLANPYVVQRQQRRRWLHAWRAALYSRRLGGPLQFQRSGDSWLRCWGRPSSAARPVIRQGPQGLFERSSSRRSLPRETQQQPASTD
ncbi:unnamed protein product [Prorocentrum cordatum]|uniref:Uncharacterized protein n=1 Tax=Prorocentrum cordatum TaxID=2364126 RepID=A0ABN9R664_9DINO|nr:unnamed protein product [Polarella glacialis]